MQRALHQNNLIIDIKCLIVDLNTRNSHFRLASSRTRLQTKSQEQLNRARSSPRLKILKVQFSLQVGLLSSHLIIT
jgi:hypothetical protein